jgi:hypothetical protein
MLPNTSFSSESSAVIRSRQRRPSRVAEGAVAGGLRESQLTQFDEMLLQRRAKGSAAAAVAASGRRDASASPETSQSRWSSRASSPVAGRSGQRSPHHDSQAQWWENHHSSARASSQDRYRMNLQEEKKLGERLHNEALLKKKERWDAIRAEVRKEEAAVTTFKPKLSPKVYKQQRKQEEERKKAAERRIREEQIRIEAGLMPLESSMTLSKQLYLVDDPHYMSPFAPPAPLSVEKHTPTISKQARNVRRTVQDLFDWEKVRLARSFGTAETASIRMPTPPRAASKSPVKATPKPEPVGKPKNSSAATQPQAAETEMEEAPPPLDLPEGPAPKPNWIRQEEEALKECRFRPKLNMESLHMVAGLGDRRITAPEHAAMTAAAEAKEKIFRRVERAQAKSLDVAAQLATRTGRTPKVEGASRHVDPVGSATKRLEQYRQRNQHVEDELAGFFAMLKTDTAYRNNSQVLKELDKTTLY